MKGEPEFARLCLSISTGIDEEASFPHSPRQVPGDLLLRAGPLPRSRGRLTLCPLTLPSPQRGEGEGSVAAVEEGEVEHHEVAVGGQDDAHHGQDEAEGEDQARAGQDGHRRHHDGDLEQRLRDQEVRVASLEAVAHGLQLLGVLLDVLLLRVVALLFLVELLQQRLVLLARGRGGAIGQVRLQPHLLRAIEVLADDLGLVESPLVGGLLLRQQHLLHGVVAAEGRDGQGHRVDGRDQRDPATEGIRGVLVQLVGLGQLDFRHALVAGPAPRDLVLHGRAARLEGGGQPLRLLLEVLAALVEEVLGAILRLPRHVLGALEEVAAVLGQQLARLAPRLGREQDGRRRARDGAEEEPPEITRRVASALIRHGLLLGSFADQWCRSLSRWRKTSTPRFTPAAIPAYCPMRVSPATAPATRAACTEMSSTRSTIPPIRWRLSLALRESFCSSPVRFSSSLSARSAVFLIESRVDISTIVSATTQARMTPTARGVIGIGVWQGALCKSMKEAEKRPHSLTFRDGGPYTSPAEVPPCPSTIASTSSDDATRQPSSRAALNASPGSTRRGRRRRASASSCCSTRARSTRWTAWSSTRAGTSAWTSSASRATGWSPAQVASTAGRSSSTPRTSRSSAARSRRPTRGRSARSWTSP